MEFLSTISKLFAQPLQVTVRRGFLGGLWSDSVEDRGDFVVINRFPYKWFANRVKQMYGTHRIEKIYELMGMSFFGKSAIKIHKFFIPELVYILGKASPSGAVQELINELVEHTWIKDIYAEKDPVTDTDMSRIDKDMDVELFDWQREFIELYDIKRKRSHLSGELLSFGCGLGKTITSLATMKAVGCDCVVVIAPKSTLKDVWQYHIEKFYRKPQKVFMIGDEPKDADFYIFNYEAMDKIPTIMKYLKKKTKLGIIVDESHNFLKIKSNRTQNLIALRNETGCNNILMQSGTPVKSVGIEIIPILRVIDGYFDEFAQEVFIKAFGVNTTLATDILHARLNLMMHRRKMEEVFTLPEKKLSDLNLKIANGNDYTIKNVKARLLEYAKARVKYHTDRMPLYKKWWDESIYYFDTFPGIKGTHDWHRYRKHVERLIEHGYSYADKFCVSETVWANKYEKDVLIPAFSSRSSREHFIECKSKIKYLDLCIQGEVLGKLENIRGEMTAKMMEAFDIEDIVENSLKKVIFFTTYIDTVLTLETRCKELGYNPVLVYGETSKNVQPLLDKFRKDKNCRVLIATMQTLATGVTLTEANTVVFCNLPYRSADREQAENRVWRIGQNTECEILTVHLDTGSATNLSDRTVEIHDWSKTMTEMIVDGSAASVDLSEGVKVIRSEKLTRESAFDSMFGF